MLLTMFFQKIKIADPDWNLDSVELPEPFTTLYERHYTNIDEIVPVEFIEKLKTIDMVPDYIRLFVWPRNSCGIWHIDGNINTFRHCSMNWILKGSGLIQFNNSIKLHPILGVHKGLQGTLEDAVEAETDGHGCIIDTASCHRVVTGDDGRTTICLSYKDKDVTHAVMLKKLTAIGMI